MKQLVAEQALQIVRRIAEHLARQDYGVGSRVGGVRFFLAGGMHQQHLLRQRQLELFQLFGQHSDRGFDVGDFFIAPGQHLGDDEFLPFLQRRVLGPLEPDLQIKSAQRLREGVLGR